ncbi:MAG: TonB-dependent receptor, partial [Caldimicrobium sp.]
TEKDWYVTPLENATRFGCIPNSIWCGAVINTHANAYMADLQFSLPILSNHILTFGGSFRQEEGNTKEKFLRDWRDEKSTVSLKYESKGKNRTYGIFIQDEIMLLDNLTAYIGFRQDWWKTYDGYMYEVGIAGYPKSYPSRSASSFSPKFALVYKPFKHTTLHASIGKSFRAPTILELYRDFTPPDRVRRMGNPALKPEKAISWDLGIEQKLWKGSKISLTLFNNYLKELIYYRTIGPQRKQLINVGKAESRGVEFQFEQKLDNWLRFFTNLTYTHSKIKENKADPRTEGCRLTYIPLWTVNSGVEIQKSGISVAILSRYVTKRYLNDDNSDKINNVHGSLDPYFVVDGRLAYQLTKFAKISLSVDNIFNKKYFIWHKAAERSWLAELSLKF